MKTRKGALMIAMIAGMALSLSNCLESADPKPVGNSNHTNLDSAKTLFSGTWKFVSVTLIQGSTTATVTDCSLSQFENAGFDGNEWMLAEQQNITFNSASTVSYLNLCSGETYDLTLVATENEDGTVNCAFKDLQNLHVTQTFVVDVATIKATTFRVQGINTYGYIMYYIFERA